jgi:hypothetical protein
MSHTDLTQTRLLSSQLQNHIDSDVSLDFEDFIDFFEKRKLKLKNLLQTTLNVTQEESETK